MIPWSGTLSWLFFYCFYYASLTPFGRYSDSHTMQIEILNQLTMFIQTLDIMSLKVPCSFPFILHVVSANAHVHLPVYVAPDATHHWGVFYEGFIFKRTVGRGSP